jgi:hypothetical protein
VFKKQVTFEHMAIMFASLQSPIGVTNMKDHEILDALFDSAAEQEAFCHAVNMNHVKEFAEEMLLPPAMRAAVQILRDHGHHVRARRNRNGSFRYSVDCKPEINAMRVCARFRHYGI